MTARYPQNSAECTEPVKYICGTQFLSPASSEELRRAEGGRRLLGNRRQSTVQTPLVSIITPVLNRATSIARTITSVRLQTYPNIEHIVIDGGSCDCTQFVLAAYADCLEYYISEPDSGIYDAINKGLSFAHGEYILILNSDDWYCEDTVEKLVRSALAQPPYTVVSALARTVDQHGRVTGAIPHFPFDEFIFFRMALRHELMLVPARVYERVGLYDASYAVLADLKFAQQLFIHNIAVRELQTHLMFFNMHGASSDMRILLAERKRLLMENFSFLSTDDCEDISKMTAVNCHACFSLMKKYSSQQLFQRAMQAYLRVCANAAAE